ncbi:MAG: tetratricopeptide repeat protein [Sphingobacteriales bacterium]|nr:tetratricopeptide repeat protein [Sphingobacteriales bacterium]
MSALSNDIATLELMVTILTIIIGLFAYLGFVNLNEIRAKISNLDDDARKKIDGIKEDADKKIALMEKEINLKILHAHNEANSKIENIQTLANQKLSEITGIKLQGESMLKILRNDADATINPSYIEAELDFIAMKLREKELKGEDFNIEDLFDLGRHHYARGYYQKAIERFMQVYSQNAKFPQITFYLGMAYDDLPNFDEAVKYYTASYENEIEFKTKALALSNRAYTYIEKARDWKRKVNNEKSTEFYKLAIDDFKTSLSILSDDPIVHYGLAIVYREIGDQQNGLSYFNSAEELIHRKHEYEILYSKKQYSHMNEALNNYYRFTK